MTPRAVLSDSKARTGLCGGWSIVEFVKVVGALYDAKDQLIGVGLTYTDLDELAPGATSSFDLLLFNLDASQVAFFRLIAEAEIKE